MVETLYNTEFNTIHTFHCNVRELLVRWDSLGGRGVSGGALWVVKALASELGPFTELHTVLTL